MTAPLPAKELDRLFDAVCRMDAGSPEDGRRVARVLYARLAAGGPVAEPALAAAAGVAPARVRQLLEGRANVERDAAGRVIGFGGLTLRPTPHRLTVDGRVRYAWCAWDTLFLPVALDAEAEVASTCGRSGLPVRLRIGPGGVIARDPAGVVLAFVEPGAVDTADLRGSFCDAVRFLSEAPATDRAGQDPARLILELDDAFELGRRMIRERCGHH